MKNAREALDMTATFTPEDLWPEPDRSLLAPERGAPPLFPGEDVFGPVLAKWIANAADAKGAPQDYVAAALIAAAGSLLGNARWPAPRKDWTEPPILWAMLVGSPSAGKSPALDAVILPLRNLEARLRRAAEPERTAWKDRQDVAKLAMTTWKEAAAKALKEGKPTPRKPDEANPGPEPNNPRLALNDATVEKLAVILSRQPRGTMLVRDELSGWLGNMSRYANGGSDRPFWIETYGGRPYSVERLSREPIDIDRLTVGVVGGIQPDKLASLLIRADDDGALARLLPIWPDSAPIRKPEKDVDVALIEGVFERLHGLQGGNDEAGNPRPWFVSFAEDAQEGLEDFRRWARDEEMNADGLLTSFIGKTPGFAVRLSMILAHLEWALTDHMSPPKTISMVHFGKACHFVSEYLLPMARRCYAEAGSPPEERAARRLARLIHSERLESFTSRDISRRKREGLRRKPDLEAALSVLLEAGWIIAEDRQPGSSGGRPTKTYRTNPKVWRLK